MKIPDKIKKNTAVIYRILCLLNNKSYIGSSCDVRRRFSTHLNNLIRKKHHSYRLQMDWCHLGDDHFVFEILEFCATSNLVEREQHYMDAYQSYEQDKGYNIARQAKQCSGFNQKREGVEKSRLKRTGQKRTEKQKARMSCAVREPIPQEGRDRRRATWEKNRENNEKSIIEKRGGDYDLISPTGERFVGRGIGKFAREHGLDEAHLMSVVKGTAPSVKGWRSIHYREKPSYQLLSPTYERVIVPRADLGHFCIANNLKRKCVKRLLAGGRPHHYGWTMIPEHLGAS